MVRWLVLLEGSTSNPLLRSSKKQVCITAIPEADMLVQYVDREVNLTVFFFLFESQTLQNTDILGGISLVDGSLATECTV